MFYKAKRVIYTTTLMQLFLNDDGLALNATEFMSCEEKKILATTPSAVYLAARRKTEPRTQRCVKAHLYSVLKAFSQPCTSHSKGFSFV